MVVLGNDGLYVDSGPKDIIKNLKEHSCVIIDHDKEMDVLETYEHLMAYMKYIDSFMVVQADLGFFFFLKEIKNVLDKAPEHPLDIVGFDDDSFEFIEQSGKIICKSQWQCKH